MERRGRYIGLVLTTVMVAGCANSNAVDTIALRHDAQGDVVSGSVENLIRSIRSGCDIKVGWGARRATDPQSTIEHLASPVWISVRNGNAVEVQLSDFLINLPVLGEPDTDHPRRERFGGTSRVVMWRANLKTDGSFDAVWYDPVTGELITRVPQNHPMTWFSSCAGVSPQPLFE